MIYDCIPFFNEIDILNLRLHILDPYVDRFVIEESTTTFSGQPKELCFEKNKSLYEEFLPRITYVVVHDDIQNNAAKGDNGELWRAVGDSPQFHLLQIAPAHARDVWQKNHLVYGLRAFCGYARIDCYADHVESGYGNPAAGAKAKPDDIVIFGDCDEIPNPAALEGIISSYQDDPLQRKAASPVVFHLAQRNFYAFLNMEEKSGRLLSVTGDFPDIKDTDRKWLGTKVTTMDQIPAEGIDRLRDLVPVTDPRSVRVADGGWHFGYMGGHHETNAARRIGIKVKAAAHQEYNDREILKETMDHLYLGQDIFGRDARFERVPLDNSFPAWLLAHEAEYDYLIMPPVSAWQRLKSRLDLTIGRFWRKGWRHVRKRLGK